MTARDVLVRTSGIAAIAGGWGASTWLRMLMQAPPHDPTLLEFGLILASFMLALGGAVLLLNGARLFGPDAKRTGAKPTRVANHWHHQSVGPLADDRAMLADLLAERARRKHRR
jgi:hypothetical protein